MNAFFKVLMGMGFVCLGGVAHAESLRLSPSSSEPGDLLGFNVDLSGDTAIVSAHFEGANDAGAVYFFRRNFGGTGQWGEVKYLPHPDPSTLANFGVYVAISGDLAVVGCFRCDPGGLTDAGAAYVFNRNLGGPDNWGLEATLTASDGASGDRFGGRVAIDGNLVVAGATAKSGQTGAAYVYDGSNGWAETKLLPAGITAGSLFGVASAVAGSHIFVSSSAIGGASRVYLFDFALASGGTLSDSGYIVSADQQASDSYGAYLDTDGQTLIVGAHQHSPDIDGSPSTRAGAAYLYFLDPADITNWSAGPKLITNQSNADAQFDELGDTVAIDGDTALIAGRSDDPNGETSGRVFQYERDFGGPNSWGLATTLVADDIVPGDNQPFVGFGVGLAIENDVIVIGADHTFSNGSQGPGAGYVIAPDVPAYACVGFDPPLQQSPVTVKGKNRVLQARAELLDAGGLAITDADIMAPPVIQVLYDSGMGGAPIDVTDQSLGAGQGTDGNQFEYTGTRWQFNLRTSNHVAEGTYEISMVSGDASEYVIDPTCTVDFIRQ